ncbi:MAG: spermidine synthase [Myxococcota bacterium]|jgi:spermidine synthase
MRRRMYDNIEFLASEEQAIGVLYLSRYPKDDHPGGWVYTVHIEGDLLMSSVSPLSERLLATNAIAAHTGTKPLRVLIGGLGLGHTAEAALDSPRAGHVRVVDRMDFVINWLRDGLLPLSERLTNDPRVELATGDVYGDLLGEPDGEWDVILVDVDHAPNMPLDLDSLPFYTPEGQAAVRRHLAPGGVLAVWSAFDSEHFTDVLKQSYARAWSEHIRWEVPNEGPLHNVLFFATDAPAA